MRWLRERERERERRWRVESSLAPQATGHRLQATNKRDTIGRRPQILRSLASFFITSELQCNHGLNGLDRFKNLWKSVKSVVTYLVPVVSFRRATGFLIVLIILLTYQLIFLSTPVSAKGPEVTLDLFVMSQCPWGTRAENIIYELKRRFGKRLKVNLYYIAETRIITNKEKERESSQIKKGQPDNLITRSPDNLVFRSLHGQPEIEEDIRQLLINKYYPDRFWGYLISRNSDIRNPDWKSHARYAGIDPAIIEEKMKKGEGSQLLEVNIKEQIAGEKWSEKGKEWYPPQASPTLYIDGELYRGPLTLPSLAVAVNNALRVTRCALREIPECYSDRDCLMEGKIGECKDVGTEHAHCKFREPAVVNLIKVQSSMSKVLSKGKDPVLEGIKGRFSRLKIKEIDCESKEAKRLIKELKIDFLPAYVLDKNVEEQKDFFRFIRSGFLIPSPEHRLPITDNRSPHYYILSSSNRPGIFINRQKTSNTLEVFSMSQCPFSIRALNKLITAKKEGKIADNIEIDVHYIATLVQPDNRSPITDHLIFRSLHGESEVEEDMRQLCIKKYYPNKFLDYLLLRMKNIRDPEWKKVVEEVGIDEATIKKCLTNREAEELLREDIKKARELNIHSSPTFLWENRAMILNFDSLKDLPGLKGLEKEEVGK